MIKSISLCVVLPYTTKVSFIPGGMIMNSKSDPLYFKQSYKNEEGLVPVG
jgi:hypothetical protein